jgi:hypothetical protein
MLKLEKLKADTGSRKPELEQRSLLTAVRKKRSEQGEGALNQKGNSSA